MKKRVLSIFVALAMVLALMPANAFAESEGENCIQIGDNTYASLQAAVDNASEGDTLWLIGDDNAEQQVTIDKSLNIELQGYALSSTALKVTGSSTKVTINDRVGTGSINKNHAAGFGTTISRCKATIVVDDGATLTINGVTGTSKDSGTIISDCTKNDLEKAIFVQGASTLVINGGTFVAQQYSGHDALFVYDGTVTINDGYFFMNISYQTAPSDTNPLTIKKCEIYNPNDSGAIWIQKSGSINGVTFSSGYQSLDSIKKLFLSEAAGNYIMDGSTANHVKIACGIYASTEVSSTTLADGTIYAVGSTSEESPEQIEPDAGDKITLAPQIAGGDGTTITYTWEKDGSQISGANGATYTIDSYSSDDDGKYKVTATESSQSVSLYYQIGNTNEHKHCVCGKSDSCGDSHDATAEWTKWESSTSLPNEAGSYYLTQDVNLSATCEVRSTVNLCLNGKTITGPNGNAAIKVYSNGSLTITDCTTDSSKIGKITHSSNKDGRGIFNEGKLILWNGSITGNTSTDNGGGVNNASGSSFIMYGGSITDNIASQYGGGVRNSGSFTMYGGTISDNTASYHGGGVYNTGSNGVFTMSGGTIKDNNASNDGGGVYNGSAATFNMSGTAAISNNKATSSGYGGGGVYNFYATLNLSGGTISGNEADYGGGVYNDSAKSGTFKMSDTATITGNSAGQGGGAYIKSGTFTMSGGSITKNKTTSSSPNYGGGVRIQNGGTFEMSGGSITENTTYSSSGGGVCNFGTVKMSGTPTISGNVKGGSFDDDGNLIGGTANNLHLDTMADTKAITVEETMGETAKVYISGTLDKTVVSGSTDTSVFFSDNAAYKLEALTGEGENGLKLATNTHTHCVCGNASCETTEGEHNGKDTEWQAWSSSMSLPSEAGNYYLTQDVTLISSTWQVSSNGVNLCLNGKTITGASGSAVINIKAIGTLTITDCNSGDKMGKITHAVGSTGRGIYNCGTLTLWKGSISGNSTTGAGGGVYNNYNSTFTMNGGTISDNTASGGGGVYNYEGTFNLNDGTISGNSTTATDYSGGGGVCNSSGTFNMAGGSITGNASAYYGGGVYNDGAFTVSGNVVISDNTKSDKTTKNNVYLKSGKTITVDTEASGMGESANVGISGTLGQNVVNGTTSTKGFFCDNDIYELVDNSSSGLKLAKLTVTIEGVKLLDKTDGNEMKATDGTYSKTYDGKAVAYSSGTYKPSTVTGVSLVYTWQKLDGDEYSDIADNVAPSDAGSYKLLVEAKRGTAVIGSCELPFTISKADGTGSVDITGWTYGDVANSPIVNSTTNGTENVSLQYKLKDAADGTYTATVPSDAGSYTVKATFAETDNYKACTATKDFTISKKTITITGATVAAKTYDGKMDANVTNVSFSGLQNSETLKLNTDYEVSSAAYNSPNAGGDNKATKVSFTVTLKDTSKANNYTLENANGEQLASISKATVVGGQAVTKGNRGEQNTYKMPDGWLVNGGKVSTTVVDTGNILSDLVSYADNVLTYTLKGTATESSNQATVTLTVSSDNYNDYTYVLEIGVTDKEKTTINIAGGEYTYNGSAQAPTDITVVDDKVMVEDLDITYEGTDGTTYGSSKTAPTNAGKYIMTASVSDTNTKYTGSASCKFEIKPKTLNVTVDAKNKTYDGKAAADVEVNLSGTVESDNITLNKTGMSAVFDSEDVGDNRTVTVSGLALNNNEAGNYVLPSTITGRANITVKTLTVENLKVADKTYDGTNKATIDGNPTLKGIVDNDNVTLVKGEPSFSKANVGENISINFTEFKLDGTDKGNYKLTQPTGIKANINAYNATGSEYNVTTKEWTNQDFVVAATEGWKLSYTNTADGSWVDKLTVSQENNNGTLEFYLKNVSSGIISEKVTETYKIDKTAPTGKISIDERNAWETFLNAISFDLFYKDAQTVTITAKDGGSGIKTIEYLITADDLTIAQLADKEFTSYTDPVGINPEAKLITYAKLTDMAGNVTYIRSDGVVIDGTAPVINGADNGKTYCAPVTLTITDEYLDNVKVNGKTAALAEGGKLIVNPAEGEQTIIATDKAGNSTSITITVNDGHTWGEWKQNEDETHIRICKVDASHTQFGNCHGGKATCKGAAVCVDCKQPYGSIDENNHANLVHVEGKAATTRADGNKEYWYCDGCGKYFGNEESTQEIEKTDTVIKKLPVIIKGNNSEATDGEKQSLIFTSDAEFADFIRVDVDGATLDSKYYTVESGSTIVTLDADYVATLAIGEHTLDIVSQNGTATAKFTVNKKATEATDTKNKTVTDDNTKSSQTGDSGNIMHCLALLLVSGGIVSGTMFAGRKKKYNR